MSSPFHAGEVEVQERLGVRSIERWARQIVRPTLPPEHREFHTSLPFLVVAARDAQGRPWASLLAGDEGFVTSPDDATLVIDARPARGDALEGALVEGADLGILGIELATRRRNRVNGRIAGAAGALSFRVDQAFGNCPQYIHPRAWRRVESSSDGTGQRSTRLNGLQEAWIRRADTFFIASGIGGSSQDPTTGMDASHRGGAPGFVHVLGSDRIIFPDYAGNNHFNTIGNLVRDPRVGLTFVDFARGSVLQITGRATIDWDPAVHPDFPGAQRFVEVAIEEVVELRESLPLRWDFSGASQRSLRVLRRVRESADVVSFELAALDGGPLPGFRPGQHLPLEVDVPGGGEPLRRTYSLSGSPSAATYRISVKREEAGIVSRHLHDAVDSGTLVRTLAPAGDFVLRDPTATNVFIGAGIGVTPLLAMLHALVERADVPATHFFHVVRNGAHHPHAREIRVLASASSRLRLHVAYSRPQPDDRPGRDFDSRGRLDAARVRASLASANVDVYLCGPVDFMAAMRADLVALGIAPGRIFSESFGPRGS